MKATGLQHLLSVWAAIGVIASAALAQEQPSTPPPAPPTTTQAAPGSADPRQQNGNMDKMASTVTRMAEMCEMMMKKEQAAMPYLLAAGITTAVLIFTALVLLIILQIQWIKYWSWKLRHLGPPSNAVKTSDQQTKQTT